MRGKYIVITAFILLIALAVIVALARPELLDDLWFALVNRLEHERVTVQPEYDMERSYAARQADERRDGGG